MICLTVLLLRGILHPFKKKKRRIGFVVLENIKSDPRLVFYVTKGVSSFGTRAVNMS